MSILLVSFGDLHLHFSKGNRTPVSSDLREYTLSRWSDTTRIAADLFRRFGAERSFLLVPGDFCHSYWNGVSPDPHNTGWTHGNFRKILNVYRERNLPSVCGVAAVLGNHDVPGYNFSYTENTVLNHFCEAVSEISEFPAVLLDMGQKLEIRSSSVSVDLWGFPCHRDVFDRLRSFEDESEAEWKVALAHAPVSAVPGNYWKSLDDLDPKFFDVLVLADIHIPFCVERPRDSGTPVLCVNGGPVVCHNRPDSSQKAFVFGIFFDRGTRSVETVELPPPPETLLTETQIRSKSPPVSKIRQSNSEIPIPELIRTVGERSGFDREIVSLLIERYRKHVQNS